MLNTNTNNTNPIDIVSLNIPTENEPIGNEERYDFIGKGTSPSLAELGQAYLQNYNQTFDAICSDINHWIMHLSNEIEIAYNQLHDGTTSISILSTIKKLENQYESAVKHSKAINKCKRSHITAINESNSDYKYFKPIPCNRHYCPECYKMGSEAHVKRCGNGFDLIEQCEIGLVDIGHMVFTIAPEVRMYILDENKISKLSKKAVEIAQEYIGVDGVTVTLHYFGDLNESNYAKFHPHFNLLFPLITKEMHKIMSYKLDLNDLQQMRVDWANAQIEVSGVTELNEPVSQDRRELEMVIHYRWFEFDGVDWWGYDPIEKEKYIKSMNHLIWYDHRSTIHPDNLIQQDDKIKEFIYFSMFRKHSVKSYGSLANRNRTKTLEALNPQYIRPQKESFKCLVDGSELKVVRVAGSNKALISNDTMQQPDMDLISENVSIVSRLMATNAVIEILKWRELFKSLRSIYLGKMLASFVPVFLLKDHMKVLLNKYGDYKVVRQLNKNPHEQIKSDTG